MGILQYFMDFFFNYDNYSNFLKDVFRKFYYYEIVQHFLFNLVIKPLNCV